MLEFGKFPDYWLQSWAIAFGLWLIIRAIGYIIEEVIHGDTLADVPNTEDGEDE